ncbi:MAG: FAD:protein FMN transferase [Gemmatimonadota bacterium]
MPEMPSSSRTPTRREFLTIGTGIFVALSVPIGMRRRLAMSRRSVPLMGTIAEVQVAHADERFAQHAIDRAIAELMRVERMMTRFKAESDIGRANLGAAREGVAVSAETATVIEAALRWASASEGRFDPAIGSASELWDVLNRHEPPPEGRVERLASRGFWRKVDLGLFRGAPAVRYQDPDVHLDLGAIAKGHGVDRAVTVLRELGVAHAIVTVGGDLYTLGDAPGGGPWQVGIRSPHDRNALAATLEVSNRAVATSGDYERFFRWHGHTYHHLIDPDTGAPRITPMHSATVLGADCINADAAATAAFGLPQERAVAIARRIIDRAEVIPLP